MAWRSSPKKKTPLIKTSSEKFPALSRWKGARVWCRKMKCRRAWPWTRHFLHDTPGNIGAGCKVKYVFYVRLQPGRHKVITPRSRGTWKWWYLDICRAKKKTSSNNAKLSDSSRSQCVVALTSDGGENGKVLSLIHFNLHNLPTSFFPKPHVTGQYCFHAFLRRLLHRLGLFFPLCMTFLCFFF